MLHQDVVDNYNHIVENVKSALLKSGRDNNTDGVQIMAVTKTIEPDRINAAISCGVELLGENRAQEFLQKKNDYQLGERTKVHFIGSLQSNKVKQIITQVDMIHSADSESLVCEIDRQAKLNNLTMDVLIQVNIAREQTKGGVLPEKLDEFARFVFAQSGVRLRGLMAIPPIGDSVRYFGEMQKLFESCKLVYPNFDTLSMGMSNDYVEAILHGANIIRLGSVLFGTRESK